MSRAKVLNRRDSFDWATTPRQNRADLIDSRCRAPQMDGFELIGLLVIYASGAACAWISTDCSWGEKYFLTRRV